MNRARVASLHSPRPPSPGVVRLVMTTGHKVEVPVPPAPRREEAHDVPEPQAVHGDAVHGRQDVGRIQPERGDESETDETVARPFSSSTSVIPTLPGGAATGWG